MDFFEDDLALPVDIEKFLSDAVDIALTEQQSERFFSWLQTNFQHYVVDESLLDDPGMLQAMSAGLGICLWNNLPLPANGFKARPVPMPGRNEPCYCGSGRKYKQCCASLPSLFSLTEADVWPMVVASVSDEVLHAGIQKGQIPPEALIERVSDMVEEFDYDFVITLLTPFFMGERIHYTNDAAGYLLNIFCDALDGAAAPLLKIELLEHVVSVVKRSPLRSDAWQRLATIYIDLGDSEKAWDAFYHAMKDDPDNISLGVLEVQLHLAEENYSHAQQRASFLVRRMLATGMAEEDGPIRFLRAVVDDPESALGNMMPPIDAELQPLSEWLEQCQERPLPRYTLSWEAPESEGSKDDLLGEGSHFLRTPGALEKVEKGWHKLFPLEKPFSTQPLPMGDEDVWSPEYSPSWLDYLVQHPQGYDSLDILDDLAAALIIHRLQTDSWCAEELLLSVLERSQAIIDATIAKVEHPRLSWLFTENRNAIRSLCRLVMEYSCEDPKSTALIRKILLLNPNDNHGFRNLLIDRFLSDGKSQEALDLCQRYPEDFQVDVLYGQVLALYQLGQIPQAKKALLHAYKKKPKVANYLIQSTIMEPLISRPGLITLGGDDEAWYYREEMREVWKKSRGILSWMKKTISNS